MLIPKVILHPLREINLMIHDDKEMTENETRLLESYIKLHNQQYEFENSRKTLQKMFSEYNASGGSAVYDHVNPVGPNALPTVNG